MTDNIKLLKEEIKSGNFRSCYILCGTERFLIRHYLNELKNRVVTGFAEMNMSEYEGKDFNVERAVMDCDTLPFISERRLVVFKDTGLFAAGRKDDSEKLKNYVGSIAETTVLVFAEQNIDKRNALYKKAAENALVAELSAPSDAELSAWIINVLKKKGKSISSFAAQTMIRNVGSDMETLLLEAGKLADYKADSQEITVSDIEACCSKSLETRIFELVDAMGNRNTGLALGIYSNMIMMKESPIMILSMISRQFRIMLQCRYLTEKGQSASQIAESLSLRAFMVNAMQKQSKNFKTLDEVKEAYFDCLETDLSIKTGKLNDRLAVELLLIKYAA